MLAPLSEQQNKNDSQSQIRLPEAPEQPLLLSNNPHQIQGNQETQTCFEILNQDLVLSLDGTHSYDEVAAITS